MNLTPVWMLDLQKRLSIRECVCVHWSLSLYVILCLWSLSVVGGMWGLVWWAWKMYNEVRMSDYSLIVTYSPAWWWSSRLTRWGGAATSAWRLHSPSSSSCFSWLSWPAQLRVSTVRPGRQVATCHQPPPPGSGISPRGGHWLYSIALDPGDDFLV